MTLPVPLKEEKQASYRLAVHGRVERDVQLAKQFLKLGNGNQHANRQKALACILERLEGAVRVDEKTVDFQFYGLCHFSAYTHPDGAMISTPGRGDEVYGSADWHSRGNIMMFRDFGDGRCIIYVCPIRPLFDLQTIGHHGVRWADVLKTSVFKQVIKID